MALFRVEEILSPLFQIHQRMNDVLQEEIPSSSSSHRSTTNACRPFILHRNHWHRLLQTYSRILSHIAEVLSSILHAPLQALFSAMASADRSLAECVAPHIHESVVFHKSPSSRNASSEEQSGAAGIADNRHHGEGAGDDEGDGGDLSETITLTEDQLTELHRWIVQKALKHALSMEVPCLHMDNLLTSSIAVHEALSNYSILTEVPFHRELAEEMVQAEGAEGAEDEDMASAERFFGGQLRQRIGNSSPSVVASAEFVLQRLRDGWDPTTSTVVSATESFTRLVVDEDQFSAVIVNGEKVIVGRGAAGTVVLKKWMVDDHIVAVKELEMATDIRRLEAAVDDDDDDVLLDEVKLQHGFATEIATQARVRHPNVLPLLCCTQELRSYGPMVPNLVRYPSASAHPYGAADAAQPNFYYGMTKKVLGLAMERMFCDLDKLIKLRKDRIQNRNRRSAGAVLALPPPFPLHVAVDMMLQIAKAMDYLHRHHIMHRDLKPANILISLDPVIPPTFGDVDDDRELSVRVKVADFSISKSGFSTNFSSMRHTANVGTGIWRAPEVMREDEEGEVLLGVKSGSNYTRNHIDEETAMYSTKADVYSFAMVCYQILTGKVPFDGDRSRALRRKIRTQQLRPEFDLDQMNNSPSMSCPMAIVDMIRNCWHPDTSARPNFTQIANFLRYMKICAVQMMMQSFDDDMDDHRQRLQQLLRMPLFSIFQSKRLWEMPVVSRKILMEKEMGSSRDAPTSSGTNESNYAMTTSTAAGTDVTNRNDGSSSRGWTDSNRRGGTAGLIAKIFKAGKSRSTDDTVPSLLSLDLVSAYTRADIIKITTNFSTKIGETGSAFIYKGTLANGTPVAVKVFEFSRDPSTFYNEVALLSRTHHRNLIRLIGYCTQNSLVLVLEYVTNGSLHDILHGDHAPVRELSWTDRLKIIKGIAQGINYLHNHCTPSVIHRDIKPDNILIAEDMEAKIFGFEISRAVYDHEEDINTSLAGTRGYIAPEYVTSGILTKKVDIYSFGILMLEIISGRQPSYIFNLMTRDGGDDGNYRGIDKWVKIRLKGEEFSEIVDSELLDSWNNNSSSIRHVLNIVLNCTNQDPTYRSTIEEIVFDLN